MTVNYSYIYYLQEFDQTALIVACENGHKDVAELLILKGADVNYRDNVRE